MDTKEYIAKADEILCSLGKYNELKYSDKSISIDELITDTELLLYKYDRNYPSLLDIKLIKERYSGQYWNFESVVIKSLSMALTKFKKLLAWE